MNLNKLIVRILQLSSSAAVRQCAAVRAVICGSAHASVHAVRAAVCGRLAAFLAVCAAVCAAVCSCPVLGYCGGSVWQCTQ
jgi:hypothetical protein